MVLKLKTKIVNKIHQALTLYDPPPPQLPQSHAGLLWNNGSVGISTGCIPAFSHDQIRTYITSLIKLIRDAADLIDSEWRKIEFVCGTFLEPLVRIEVSRTRATWGIIVGLNRINFGGVLAGRDIVIKYQPNLESIRPFFEKCLRDNGEKGILLIHSITNIKLRAIIGIKRY
jgi:hypothetical protein